MPSAAGSCENMTGSAAVIDSTDFRFGSRLCDCLQVEGVPISVGAASEAAASPPPALDKIWRHMVMKKLLLRVFLLVTGAAAALLMIGTIMIALQHFLS